MYQQDISDLRQDEVDWAGGTITCKRNKTRNRRSAQAVTYPLWPETLRLLRECRSSDATRVLSTERGTPLVRAVPTDSGRVKRSDSVRSAFERLRPKLRLPLKCLRKTSAQMLSQHRDYSRWCDLFLAHAPRTVAGQHYINEARNPQFAEAVMWVGKEYGLVGPIVIPKIESFAEADRS